MTTVDSMTIGPEAAAELYEAWQENTEAEDLTCGGWTAVADRRVRSGRWKEHRWLVLRHDSGSLWGLPYNRGLTERQEDEFPWEKGHDPIPLVRLVAREVTTVQYRRA